MIKFLSLTTLLMISWGIILIASFVRPDCQLFFEAQEMIIQSERKGPCV